MSAPESAPSGVARRLSADTVSDFVRHKLFAPGRQRAVIALTTPAGAERPSIDAARLASDLAAHADVDLASLLIDCVEGGASVSFMLPLTRDRALAFWRRVALEVAAGERALLVADDAHGLCGTVQLILAQPENQPHRADLAKLLVHRRARRQGLGAALMRAAEAERAARGRSARARSAIERAAPARRPARFGGRGIVRRHGVVDSEADPGGAHVIAWLHHRSVRDLAFVVAAIGIGFVAAGSGRDVLDSILYAMFGLWGLACLVTAVHLGRGAIEPSRLRGASVRGLSLMGIGLVGAAVFEFASQAGPTGIPSWAVIIVLILGLSGFVIERRATSCLASAAPAAPA